MNPFRAFTLLTLMTLLLTGCFVEQSSPPPDMPAVITATPQPALIPEADDPPGGFASAAAGHPLSIAALRGRTYEGSDFVLEQTLDPGVNYARYVASYQSDGLKIYALLTIPQTPMPPEGYPVVIFNHGYIPPDEYRTTERYVAYVDAFARSGYIVVKSDYRGHGFSEGEPQSAYGSPGYVIDVLNAVASARRLAQADPNRIGMWGHSMGGYITLRAMVTDPSIRAGVIWAGVVASYEELLSSWFSRGSGSRRSWLSDALARYGTPDANPDFWAALSANSFLNDLGGPIQIHHGTGDTTVPYQYSVLLDEEMRAAGEPVELYLYPGDDHNIAANRDGALALSVVFFDRYVRELYGAAG